MSPFIGGGGQPSLPLVDGGGAIRGGCCWMVVVVVVVWAPHLPECPNSAGIKGTGMKKNSRPSCQILFHWNDRIPAGIRGALIRPPRMGGQSRINTHK